MSRVVDSYWFDKIGIVQVVQEHQWEYYRQTGDAQFKYYIGTGWGEDQKTDASYIAEHGMPFDVIAGNALFHVTPQRFVG
jgi:hypothetical protein